VIKEENMNLIEEVEAIRNSPAHGTACIEHLFWKLTGVVLEMAKRIEGLEQREHAYARLDPLLLPNDQS